MGAPTYDKVLPPLVFLIALLTAFLFLVIQMNPTIQENQQAAHTAPTPYSAPAYESQLFENNTMTWLTPNPYTVTPADRLTNYPLSMGSSTKHIFSTPQESSFNIHLFIIGQWTVYPFGDRHQLSFEQSGGWFGIQLYQVLVNYPDDWVVTTINGTGTGTIVTSMACEIPLRHVYTVLVTPGPGENNVISSFESYNYNISIGLRTGNMSTNPWVIAGQLFTFNLPGMPLWMNALIMTPIFATIGVVAYIVIRSAFPG